MAELGLADVAAYREQLERNPLEWRWLDALCTISISRFWRNAGVFDRLVDEVLPGLAERALLRGDRSLRCWSAGCASGEEPYSLAMAWEHRLRHRFPSLALNIIATDCDPKMIERAHAGRFSAGSLNSLPASWARKDFVREGDQYRVLDFYRNAIDFRLQDLRATMPRGPFDLVLCRNLAFTYFDEALQGRVFEGICASLHSGGILVLGSHESPPEGVAGVTPLPGIRGTFLKVTRHWRAPDFWPPSTTPIPRRRGSSSPVSAASAEGPSPRSPSPEISRDLPENVAEAAQRTTCAEPVLDGPQRGRLRGLQHNSFTARLLRRSRAGLVKFPG